MAARPSRHRLVAPGDATILRARVRWNRWSRRSRNSGASIPACRVVRSGRTNPKTAFEARRAGRKLACSPIHQPPLFPSASSVVERGTSGTTGNRLAGHSPRQGATEPARITRSSAPSGAVRFCAPIRWFRFASPPANFRRPSGTKHSLSSAIAAFGMKCLLETNGAECPLTGSGRNRVAPAIRVRRSASLNQSA